MGTAPAIAKPLSSKQPGMGAIPYAGGVTFRVWAKFASSVSVAGDFNNWSTTANPLAPDGSSGYWSVDVPAAKIGDNYKFYIPESGLRVDPYASSVFKDVAAGAKNTQLLWKAKVSSQTVTFDATTGFTMPSWNDIVIYELHIGTFTTQPSGAQGTLTTALDKLKSIADPTDSVGFNAIEIMPLGQYLTITSSGYNPGYIFAVEDTYGGPDAFRTFVNAVHALQLAAILDVVYNHLGDTDLWQFDGWSMPGIVCRWCGYTTVNGGDYVYQDASLGHTDYSHARFDFGRPEVQNYLCDNVSRWLELRFLDGLRFDSTINIRGVQHSGTLECNDSNGVALLKQINQQVQTSQPWKLTIAEDLQNWNQITAPVATGGMGFSAQWSDSLCYALRGAVIPCQRRRAPHATHRRRIERPQRPQRLQVCRLHREPRQGRRRQRRRPPPRPHPSRPVRSWGIEEALHTRRGRRDDSPRHPHDLQGQEFLAWQSFPNDKQPPQIDWSIATTLRRHHRPLSRYDPPPSQLVQQHARPARSQPPHPSRLRRQHAHLSPLGPGWLRRRCGPWSATSQVQLMPATPSASRAAEHGESASTATRTLTTPRSPTGAASTPWPTGRP